jgi:hypothetical protein
MRQAHSTETTETRDFSLAGGCILCGGDLAFRVTPGRARSVCKACRWISRPHMRRDDEGIHVVHPAGLFA